MSEEEVVDALALEEPTVDEPVEEITEDSSVVEEPEETPEEPVEEPAEEPEETPDEPEEGEDLDFEEWAKQYGELPDGIKSEEDLMESYQSMLPEMKRAQTDAAKLAQVEAALKARGFNGAEGLLSGDVPPQPQSQPERLEKSYFGQSPAMDLVEQMRKDGRLRDDPDNPGASQSYSAMGQFIDNAMAPELKKFEDVYEHISGTVIAMQNKMRDLLWKDVPAKMRQGVERKDIDALIDKGLFNDYTEAINFHSFNNPNALRKLADKAEERGGKKERRKLRRSKAIRKSKTPAVQTKKWDYHKFFDEDGGWDQGKLSSLPGDDASKMLSDYEKEMYKN